MILQLLNKHIFIINPVAGKHNKTEYIKSVLKERNDIDYEIYNLFGRGCLNNLYDILKVTKPSRGTKDKEMYLCTTIAWRNHKFFLSRNKKYALIQKYVVLKYLNDINFNKYPYNVIAQGEDVGSTCKRGE